MLMVCRVKTKMVKALFRSLQAGPPIHHSLQDQFHSCAVIVSAIERIATCDAYVAGVSILGDLLLYHAAPLPFLGCECQALSPQMLTDISETGTSVA